MAGFAVVARCCVCLTLLSSAALGQAPAPAAPYPPPASPPPPQYQYPQSPPPPQYQYPQSPPPPGAPHAGYPSAPAAQPGAWSPPAPARKRGRVELGTLYGMSVGYGVGLGVWLSSELDLDDPGLFLIAPAVLGVAAPLGVYALDYRAMPRGLPAATATGMFLGTAEAVGIVSMQHVHTSDANAWGFTELMRGTAIGSSVGSVAGYLWGYYLEPEPEASLFVGSGALWGTALGSMFGYGATRADQDFAEANDPTSVAGFVGLNLGAAASAGLSLLWTPSARQIGSMWAGAGIGLAASLPVYLFYLGEDSPPARRGLIFSATAILLGIGVGGLVGHEGGPFGSGPASSWHALRDGWFSVDAVLPMPLDGGFGAAVAGKLF